MAQVPPKRKRINPVPVASQESNRSGLQPVSPGETAGLRPGPVEYQSAPSTLPGRRLKADISSNYLVDYKELLKKNGINPKELKARKNAAAAAAKEGKAPSGLPPLPGLSRIGGSPSAAKQMYGNVVDRLERIYAAQPVGDDSDEGEEGETEEGEDEESDADGSDESSSEAEEEHRGAADQSEPGTDAGGAAGTGTAGPGGGESGPGGASDSAAAAKKPRKRRPQIEAYEADFIDDDDEIMYEKARKAKPKYDGFYINQGPVEVELPADEDEEQAARRAPRPRQPSAVPSAKTKQPPAQQQQQQPPHQKHQEPVSQQGRPPLAPMQQAGTAAAAVMAAAAVAVAAATEAPAAGGSTPVRGAKRRPDSDGQSQQQQPAVKKRKQAAQPSQPDAPGGPQPAAAAAAAGAEAAKGARPTGPSAGTGAVAGSGSGAAATLALLVPARSLAAMAAMMGKSTASGVVGAVPLVPAAANGAVRAKSVGAEDGGAPEAVAGASSPTAAPATTVAPAPPVGTAAVGAAAAAAAAVAIRVPARRSHSSASASVDQLIADCVKKLKATANPPSDWSAALKLLDAPLTQLALFLHRSNAGEAAQKAAREELAAALARAAPALQPPASDGAGQASQGGSQPGSQGVGPESLAGVLQRKVEKNLSSLAACVTAVQKLAREVVEAETAAAAARAAAGTTGAEGHSSDDEFAEPSGAANPQLESLEVKLRSYLNLHHRLKGGEDDEGALRALAEQVKADPALILRAARPLGQRKRQAASKAAAAGTAAAAVAPAEDAQARQLQAAAIALEVARAVGAVTGRAAAGAAAGAAGEVLAPTTGVASGGQQAGSRASAPSTAPTAVAGTGTGAAGAGPAASGPGVPPAPPVTAPAAATAAPAEAAGSAPSEEVRITYPEPAVDQKQREACKEAVRKASGGREDMLETAFKAAGGNSVSVMTIKVLCFEPGGLRASDIGQRARDRGYVTCSTATKAASDRLRRLVYDCVNKASMAAHVIHVGGHKYMLRALRPDMEPVARPPGNRGGGAAGGGGGGGSANSSPAAALVPNAARGGAAAAAAAMAAAAEPPPAFRLPPDEPPRSSLPTVEEEGEAAGAGAGEGPGAVAEGGGGGGEEEVWPNAAEDERQCRECVEAAAEHGADPERVTERLACLRSRNPRAVFKTLCHAGASGMRVADIVRSAIERRFVGWTTADKSRSVHQAIRSAGGMVVHVGSHFYALAVFPGVTEVAKPPSKGGGQRGAGTGVSATAGGGVAPPGLG